MRRVMLAVAVAMALSGCASQYGSNGVTGGVDAQQLSADTFRIVANGNGFTSQSRVHDFALLKAAETTLASGKTHFVILSQSNTTHTQHNVTPGTVQTTRWAGGGQSTVYQPGAMNSVEKPGLVLTIRVQNGGGQSAHETIKYVRPRVRS